MFALRAHDDTDAELVRLRRDLLAFVVDEISRTAPPGGNHALAGPVADAIIATAASATRAELIHLSHDLAIEMIGALQPHLAECLPPLVQAAVATALATALAEQPTSPAPPPAALPWMPFLALNGFALAVALAALLVR